jgi:hypothetical protein
MHQRLHIAPFLHSPFSTPERRNAARDNARLRRQYYGSRWRGPRSILRACHECSYMSLGRRLFESICRASKREEFYITNGP